MIKWAFKFFLVILRIVSVFFLFFMPYQTYSEYTDPWDRASTVRREYSDSYFIVAIGGSWSSTKGQSRQSLLLIPKTWATPKFIDIDAGADNPTARSGMPALIIVLGLLVLAICTIASPIRRISDWQKKKADAPLNIR